RFLVRLEIGYPDEDGEDEVLSRFETDNPLEALEPVVESGELLRLITALGRLHVDPVVRRYCVQLVRATREEPAYDLGASPRAALGLFRAARAAAALAGRDYVLPDDVKEMAPHVLPHRLILSSQSRLRGRETGEVLKEVLDRVPVPVEG
ncbi:MAG TPA: MoxR family ATPase, partial [Dehalococcoidia bacterium]|nr:MoxR family ATPase [Dehalococcoidia bacterium]